MTDIMQQQVRMAAEWETQWGVQLTWPHKATDWAPYLHDIELTYIEMARAIAAHERLVIVAPDTERVRQLISKDVNMENVRFHQCPTNDTWARDHAFLSLTDGSLLDFRFNGWGDKFAADKDNAINRSLFASLAGWMEADINGNKKETTAHETGHEEAATVQPTYSDQNDFVLEGGSIESDGHGTLFTTTHCLLAHHRNQPLCQQQIEAELKRRLHADRVLWIDHGHLDGDDTDGHIDTIVRIAPDDTLLYIGSDDPTDEHYDDLKAMETQLRTFHTTEGKPYRLLRLPMAEAIYDDGERLPATYANYLVLNGAVLVPTYQQPSNDRKALHTIQQAFPCHKLIAIDSRTIVRQHGSIHCCTMQYPLFHLSTKKKENNETGRRTEHPQGSADAHRPTEGATAQQHESTRG